MAARAFMDSMSTQQTSAPTLPRLHSARSICEARGISEATLWRERQRGMLDEPIQISAGRKGWTDEQIAAWQARRQASWQTIEAR
jgi:predicted DNA-binding transcriptional regulator AlpA